MIDVEQIRRLFPHTGKSVYFNVASNGPLPEPAFKLQDEYFQLAKMAGIGAQEELFEALENIRCNGAKIFGCRKSETGFGFNTTFGINLAAFGLPLKKGDEVLLSDIEFPANVYPWLELRNRGIKVRFLKSKDGFFDIDNFRRAITGKTRALSLSFVQYFNGYKNDLETIGNICRDQGIFFIVDAIQGAGPEPMNVKKWNVDIASAGGQKWLLGSQGSGVFYISNEIKKQLIPPWRSWLGVDWKCDWSNLRDFNRRFEPSAQQYEMGTYPAAQVLSLDWTLSFLVDLGIKEIQKHNYSLLNRLIEYLQSEPFYRITGSLEKKHRSSILSFTTDKGDITRVYRLLLKKKIIPALREGSIRVSVHLYNNQNDIDRLIAGLRFAVTNRDAKS